MGQIMYGTDPRYITLNGSDLWIVDRMEMEYDYCSNERRVEIEAVQFDKNYEQVVKCCQKIAQDFLDGFSEFLDQMNSSVEEVIMMNKTFNVDKVHFSGPATVIIWKDGEKTIVQISKSDKKTKNDRRIAIMWALANRYFGSRCQHEKRLVDARNYGAKNDNATVRSLLVALFKSTKNLDDFINKIVGMAKEN